MLRIYHFILDHRMGGQHVYVDSIRKVLANEVESVIVTTGTGPMTDISLINLRHRCSLLYLLEVPFNILRILWLVALGKIRRKDCLFNIHGSANIAPIMAARLLDIPVVWHFHETLPKFKPVVDFGRWFLKGHKHQIVVVANKAKEVFGLEDAVLIPAAVDTDYWSRKRVTSEDLKACCWGERKGNSPLFRVLAVGNLNPLKGVDTLVEAMGMIEGPWDVKVVGAKLDTHRDYANGLYRRADEVASGGRGKRIEFLGWQDQEKVRSLMACCDVFVLPSRSEACPIALLEAMAMGCVCVAADVGDVAEILSHGHVGILVQDNSTFGWKRAINSLMVGERKRYGDLRQLAQKKAVASYSLGVHKEKFINLYYELFV